MLVSHAFNKVIIDEYLRELRRRACPRVNLDSLNGAIVVDDDWVAALVVGYFGSD